MQKSMMKIFVFEQLTQKMNQIGHWQCVEEEKKCKKHSFTDESKI